MNAPPDAEKERVRGSFDDVVRLSVREARCVVSLDERDHVAALETRLVRRRALEHLQGRTCLERL